MSCPDSQVFWKDKSFASGDMGDVLGKESDDAEGDEVSQEYKDCAVLREDADGAPSSDENDINQDAADDEVNKMLLFHKAEQAVDEDSVSGVDDSELSMQQSFNGNQNQSNQRCSCDSCKNYRISFDTDSVEEMRMAQSRWMELRQYIRSVYRMAMEGNTSPVQPYQPHIKELVYRLCNRNPHLLFQRLEAQVQEFVIEAKVRQLELLHREKQTPQLARLFLTGLLDSYKKLMSAATQLAPLLEQLQKVHLNKFNVTWKVLNQHLYQSCVYTDPLVQNNVPHFISELSKCCDENAESNKKLVHDFLSFDDEITLVGGMWRDAETRIHQYNQEQATLKAKERMLKEDWKLFKEQRKLFQQKMWNKTISEICDSDGDNDDINLTGHRGCPCDECAMTHIFCGGLVTPPHSPGLPSYTSNHKLTEVTKVDGEGQEVGATAIPSSDVASCECHVCTAPPMNLDNGCDTGAGVIVNSSPGTPHTLHSATGPGCGGGGSGGGGGGGVGFHLYPHIHGTGGGGGSGTTSSNVSVGSSVYPHLYNIHTTLLQHHNSITSTNVPINGTSIDQSVTTTPQPAVNTTTTITTTTVINDSKQVTTDCDVSRNSCTSPGVSSKSINITTRPGTPPPPAPRPLGVLKYNSGVSVSNNNGTSPVSLAKSIAQHSNGSVGAPGVSHHQQQQRTHRHSTTQTTPQPQQPQSIAASQSTLSAASPSLSLSEHHSHSTNGHSRLHQHQSGEQHNINNKVPQTGNSMPPNSCHKHAEPIKRVSTSDPHAGDDDESVSPEDSCSERSTSTQRDSRHCDCCYCEVFGHGVPSVAPVSRNYQEMRERLRQLLTKKKAKCKAAAANSSANSNHNNSNSINNSSSPSAAVHTSSSSSLTSSVSSSSSSSSSVSSAKLTSNTAPLTNGMVANATTIAALSSSSTTTTTIDVQKDPRDLEDLLDFIEGNPSAKCKDAKKAAKKARQKQKKQEELDRKKREEEEAERRRQELIIQQQKQQAALLKKQQQQQKQKKKDKNGGKKNNNNNRNNSSSNNNTSNVGNNASSNNNSNGPQMVTIKRVMEPNSAEPTVTITLRGATPSEDKVLYTLLNGQVCQVQKETKNSKGKQQSNGNGSNKGKNNNSNNNNNNNNISNYNNKNTVQQQNKKNTNSNNNSSSNHNSNNSKNLKKENSNTVHIQMNGHINGHHSNNNCAPSNVSNKKSSKSSSLSSTRNGNINTQMSHHTTTQVPPPAAPPQLTSPTAIQINNAINRLSSSKPNMSNFSLDNLKLPPGITITKVDPATVQQRRPPAQTRQQVASTGTGSAAPAPPPVVPPKPAASNVIVVDTGRLKDLTTLQHNEFNGNVDEVSNNSNSKKKKKNKKNNNNNVTANGTVNNNNNRDDVASVIGGSGGSVTLINRAQPQPQNGKLVMPQAAAIIKVNGSMVTIRSPALQQALANKTEAAAAINSNGTSANDQNKKRRKKKKGANGQGQPDEWNLVDSVFAPKDIDLDNGDIDDAERELEAFKRFCLQSVPPKQKEKVHLNIKDIVLKKKASAISCS